MMEQVHSRIPFRFLVAVRVFQESSMTLRIDIVSDVV